MDIIRGQKLKLSEIFQSLDIQVGINIVYKGLATIDIACFGVDQNNKLSDDRYFIFFNQPSSPENAIKKTGAVSGDNERFEIYISKLPSFIKKLVFTAAIDGDDLISNITNGYLRLLSNNQELARFSFSGSDFLSEKAIIIGEIYFKDIWRFSAVGQGFNGGLSALLKHFGGEEIKQPETTPIPTQAPQIPKTPPPKVNISKVTLEKRGDKKKVDISKKNVNQPIHINLNWDANVTKKGFFGNKTINADLDLGCMFKMNDGNIGVIQALGNSFGSKIDYPYIFLDKDDRTGQQSDGENLYIIRPDLINLVMIFSFIYEGAANFTDVNGRVSIKDQSENEIFIRLNNPDSKKLFCTICTIKNIGNEIEITKEERYFVGHQDADNHYGFGFSWRAGKK